MDESATVLVVDDEPRVLDALEAILAAELEEGFQDLVTRRMLGPPR